MAGLRRSHGGSSHGLGSGGVVLSRRRHGGGGVRRRGGNGSVGVDRCRRQLVKFPASLHQHAVVQDGDATSGGMVEGSDSRDGSMSSTLLSSSPTSTTLSRSKSMVDQYTLSTPTSRSKHSSSRVKGGSVATLVSSTPTSSASVTTDWPLSSTNLAVNPASALAFQTISSLSATLLPANASNSTAPAHSNTGILIGLLCGLAFAGFVVGLTLHLVRSQKKQKRMSHAAATFQPSTISSPRMAMSETSGPNSTFVQMPSRSGTAPRVTAPPPTSAAPTWRNYGAVLKSDNPVVKRYGDRSASPSSSNVSLIQRPRETAQVQTSYRYERRQGDGSPTTTQGPSDRPVMLKPLILPQPFYRDVISVHREEKGAASTWTKGRADQARQATTTMTHHARQYHGGSKSSSPSISSIGSVSSGHSSITSSMSNHSSTPMPRRPSVTSPLAHARHHEPTGNTSLGNPQTVLQNMTMTPLPPIPMSSTTSPSPSPSSSGVVVIAVEPTTRVLASTSPQLMSGLFPLPPTSQSRTRVGQGFPGTMSSQGTGALPLDSSSSSREATTMSQSQTPTPMPTPTPTRVVPTSQQRRDEYWRPQQQQQQQQQPLQPLQRKLYLPQPGVVGSISTGSGPVVQGEYVETLITTP